MKINSNDTIIILFERHRQLITYNILYKYYFKIKKKKLCDLPSTLSVLFDDLGGDPLAQRRRQLVGGGTIRANKHL